MKSALDFFGGRDEVLRRFSERIQASLQGFVVKDLLELERRLGLNSGTLGKLVRGHRESLNKKVIEKLSDACNLDLTTCLGEFQEFTPQDQEEWQLRADEEEFIFVGGATEIPWSPVERIKLFIVLCAISDLDNEEIVPCAAP